MGKLRLRPVLRFAIISLLACDRLVWLNTLAFIQNLSPLKNDSWCFTTAAWQVNKVTFWLNVISPLAIAFKQMWVQILSSRRILLVCVGRPPTTNLSHFFHWSDKAANKLSCGAAKVKIAAWTASMRFTEIKALRVQICQKSWRIGCVIPHCKL